MPSFSLRNPYTVIVSALVIVILGVTAFMKMAVDVFPNIKIPAVVVATFYQGMPPLDMEDNITFRYERFFTLGSNIEHVESRSLSGVSIIKVFFQPGTDIEAAAAQMGTLAMADLGIMPPGTLPPLVLQYDASSLPVVLVTVEGKGYSETQLEDQARYNIRNQLATVPGASVPIPFGGKFRQVMAYANAAGAAGARTIADGRGPRARPIQSDTAGRRRKARRQGLLHLFQQHDRERRRY